MAGADGRGAGERLAARDDVLVGTALVGVLDAAELLANDGAPGGGGAPTGPLRLAWVRAADPSTLYLYLDPSPGGGVAYALPAGFLGTATFAYAVEDASGRAGTAVASLVRRPPPPPPLVEIAGVAPGLAPEGTAPGPGGSVVVALVRSGDLSGASIVDVLLAGAGGRPTGPEDLVGGFAPRLAVAFAPGVARVEVVVALAPDAEAEGDEGVSVTLADAWGADLGAKTAVEFLVADDDVFPPPPLVRISAVSPAAAAEGTPPGPGSAHSVVLARSGDLSGTSTVRLLLEGTGEAPASADDLADGFAPRLVTFAPGEATARVVVRATPDALAEATEGVRVVLTGPVGAALGVGATATFLISDDDPPASSVPPRPAPTEPTRVWRGSDGAEAFDLPRGMGAAPGARHLVQAFGGDDTVRGGSGADHVFAGVGRDVVDGGAGDDTLVGGSGADRLIGGPGADRFQVFAGDLERARFGGGPVDTILGFEGAGARGGDFLEFRGLGAGARLDFLREVGGGGARQLYALTHDANGAAPGGLVAFEIQVDMAAGRTARLAAGLDYGFS